MSVLLLAYPGLMLVGITIIRTSHPPWRSQLH